MSKKLIIKGSIAALCCFAVASCNKAAQSGKEDDVRFSVALETGVSTKVDGLGEAGSVDKLDVFVYDAAGNYMPTIVPAVTKIDGTHYSVTMRLLNNVKYHFVFFAQKSGTYAYSTDRKSITLDYSAIPANRDAYDAFFAHINDYTVSGDFNTPVTLRRPFAQINFGSVKADYLAAEASKVAFDASLQTSIVAEKVPSVLNLLTGEASVPVKAVFQAAPYMGSVAGSGTLTVNSTPALSADQLPVRYMEMAYVLAGDTQANLDKVTLQLSGKQNGNAFSSVREVTNVPVRRNYRTSIVGNMFTGAAQFTVTIAPAFQTPDYRKDF